MQDMKQEKPSVMPLHPLPVGIVPVSVVECYLFSDVVTRSFVIISIKLRLKAKLGKRPVGVRQLKLSEVTKPLPTAVMGSLAMESLSRILAAERQYL